MLKFICSKQPKKIVKSIYKRVNLFYFQSFKPVLRINVAVISEFISLLLYS